jgi:transposase-like protein
MEAKIHCPKTQMEAIQYFANLDNCHEFMMNLRWPNGVICPRCGSHEIGKLSLPRRVWNCKNKQCSNKQFSAKVGTIFEDSPLGLDKWLTAVWLIVNAKNGISSYELHRAIGVTQKTAWFMNHRIRLALQDGSIEKMKGRVEADETFIGGLARNMHKSKRTQTGRKTGSVGMAAVMGLLERKSPERETRVRCKVLETTKRYELRGQIDQHVEKGSEVITDAYPAYVGLHDEYTHKVIDHAVSYVEGHVHTNGLENFWSLLKRGLKGTYVSVEPFHLFRYLDEQAFRFNERKDDDGGRFLKAVGSLANRRLTYKQLTGKVVA